MLHAFGEWGESPSGEKGVELKRAEKRFRLATDDYARLAAFRHALRKFLRFSEMAAAAAGLTSKHYQAMLVVRSRQEDERVTINDLAQQLMIKHNSAVELVDRLVRQDLIVRKASSSDRRKVELCLTPRGRQVLAKLAGIHSRELQRIGPVLEGFFAELSSPGRAGRGSRPRRRSDALRRSTVDS